MWDVDLPKDVSKAPTLGGQPNGPQAPADAAGAVGDTVTVGGVQDRSTTVGGQPPASSAAASAVTGTGKKKGKEVMVTADQISAFPTKKTPVLRAEFTRMNLIVAAGCFEP